MDLATTQELQTELRKKNEMVNLLISQNFQELLVLQKKHQESAEQISSSYQSNLGVIEASLAEIRAKIRQTLREAADEELSLSHRSIELLRSDNVRLTKLVKAMGRRIRRLQKENATVNGLAHRVEGLEEENRVLKERVAEQRMEAENLTSERDLARQEVCHYRESCRTTDQRFREEIRRSQEEGLEAMERTRKIHREEIERLTLHHSSQLQDTKREMGVELLERGKQIDSLTSCLKTFTESQHIAFVEAEKYKLENERLRDVQSQHDHRIATMVQRCRTELEEKYQRERKDLGSISESYQENMERAREINQDLQAKLEKALDTIRQLKTALRSLREDQEQSRRSSSSVSEERTHLLESEIDNLRTKLDASLEANRRLSKERTRR